MTKRTVFKYLIECVLIFASVIAAFIFDNERDKREFKEQELNLLRDVMGDLISDSLQYVARINQATILRTELTYLIRQLESKKVALNDVSTLFKPIEIVLNKTTYDVIKSTGGFRYINDKELVDGLSDYYNSRTYISEIYSKVIMDTDTRIGELLIAETNFIDNTNPQPSYLIFSHSIALESLNGLKGNQRLINLCYAKRTFLDQLIVVFTNFCKAKSKELYIKCEKYLELKS
jgi:hypothetical protein